MLRVKTDDHRRRGFPHGAGASTHPCYLENEDNWGDLESEVYWLRDQYLERFGTQATDEVDRELYGRSAEGEQIHPILLRLVRVLKSVTARMLKDIDGQLKRE